MKRFSIFLLTVVLCSIFGHACQEKGNNSVQISRKNSDDSHYYGQNCVDCHYTEGPGDGWFTLAGSVSGNSNSSTIELYTGPNGSGTLVDIIEVDRLGNFYTTNYIDFSKGLYTALRESNGKREHMEDQIFYGQCNLCHGAQEDIIETD